MIEFYNIPDFIKILESDNSVVLFKAINKQFSAYNINADVTFIKSKEIQDFNKKYRSKNVPTDVLSFESGLNNLHYKEKTEIWGEVFICVDYILKQNPGRSAKWYITEVLRMIIHGLLHVSGYNHKKNFTEEDYKDEKMYLLQEDILNVVLNTVQSK